MLLVKFLQALEYLIRLFDRRLADLDLLKPPGKGAIAFTEKRDPVWQGR